MGPLSGVRIIDMTTVLMGPSATQALAQLGAEVLKVEAPEGDVTRGIGPARHPGMSALYLNANAGKRSISLDLKRPEAGEVLFDLIADADVLAFNVRPRAMRRLGLDWDSVRGRNPRLIYAAMVGFGQDGPYAAKPAYDDLIQGASGLAAMTAAAGDGTPRYAPAALADRIVGMAAVGAICAALFERERTGLGSQVQIAMFETMVSLTMADHLAGQTFDPPLPGRGYDRLLSRHRKPCATKDGYVCALVYTDRQWAAFLDRIGMADLPRRDPRFASFASRAAEVDHVYAFLGEVFTERTTADWLETLDAIDVPVMPLHDSETLMRDPHLSATSFFESMDHPTEGKIRTMRSPLTWPGRAPDPVRAAPRQGADGAAVLRELGWTDERIDALAASGALVLPAGV
jgi:crotonobetainyl-CoA:carnitine CoA-transferase CaiB-like acyl-CoA transferase